MNTDGLAAPNERLRQTDPMRTSTRLLWISLGLAAVGLGLVVFHHSEYFTGYSMGNADKGDGYSSGLAITFDHTRIVTTQQMIGFGLIWLASLIAVGVATKRSLERSSPPRD